MTSHPITRREFLRKTGAAAIVATAAVPLLARGEVQKGAKVILIRNENVINGGGTLNGKILEKMLDEAMTHLMDVKTPADAWKEIIRPTDVVGIKTNVWRYLRTPV